jgi:predicted TIM-barrel fold metal-dependent hydrolase
VLFAPVLSFRDPVETSAQLDWLIERGCKVVTFCTGPAYGRSPGDRHFDAIWSRLDEAGVVAAYHINEGMRGYKAERSAAWGEEPYPTFFTQSAWQWAWAYGEQPAVETFSSLIYSNLFQRFPNVKILSAEHGCEWVPAFMRRMDKMRGMGRNGRWLNGQLPERPSEIFRRHFRVVPYWEDDITSVVDEIGDDVIVGGSDFPHSEGLAFPTQLVDHVRGLDETTQRRIMRDNGMALVGLS